MSNRAFRYGDGFFETIKYSTQHTYLFQFHWERIQAAASALQLPLPDYFSSFYLEEQFLKLAEINNLPKARFRLSFWPGEGGLLDKPGDTRFLLETFPFPEHFEKWNHIGLKTGLFTETPKQASAFSGFKLNSFFPYTLAARHAAQAGWNDAILVNQYGRVADSTIANIFILQDGVWKTPALSEGPVAGVYRRFILESVPATETTISIHDLRTAEAIVLCNSIRGVQWVQQFEDRFYSAQEPEKLFHQLSSTF